MTAYVEVGKFVVDEEQYEDVPSKAHRSTCVFEEGNLVYERKSFSSGYKLCKLVPSRWITQFYDEFVKMYVDQQRELVRLARRDAAFYVNGTTIEEDVRALGISVT